MTEDEDTDQEQQTAVAGPSQGRATQKLQVAATHAHRAHPYRAASTSARAPPALDAPAQNNLQQQAPPLPTGLPDLNIPRRRNRRRDARQILADVSELTLEAQTQDWRNLAETHREMLQLRARQVELEERRMTATEQVLEAIRDILKNFGIDFFKHLSG